MGIIKIKKDMENARAGKVPERLMMNADKTYIQEQPEGFGEFLFACLCAPCYACARTRYACTACVAWTACNILLWVIMAVTGSGSASAEVQVSEMSQEDMGDAQMLLGDVAVSQPSVA